MLVNGLDWDGVPVSNHDVKWLNMERRRWCSWGSPLRQKEGGGGTTTGEKGKYGS